ncbi:hypothetical protein HWV62_41010 [Athelia sp. TMB]|nr:hypothetical protein HWV62_41010 [Athelia sp. TMB]
MQIHILEYLVTRGGNVNITDEDGDTPIYTVENIATAQWLVEHGADVHRYNGEGISPIEHLAEDFPAVASYLASLPNTSPAATVSSPVLLARPEQPSQHSQNAASEELTSTLIERVSDVATRAEIDGRDLDEEELRAVVERTVIDGLHTGYGMSVNANGEEREERDEAKRLKRDEGPMAGRSRPPTTKITKMSSSGWDRFSSLSTYVTTDELAHLDISTPTPSDHNDSTVLRLVTNSRSKGYDSACIPLTTEKWRARWRGMCILSGEGGERDVGAEERAEAWRAAPVFMRDEVTITRLDEAEGVTAMISDWLELDAEDDWVRHDSEIALQQELAYACYLNVTSVILPPPRNRAHVASYARAVNECMKGTPYVRFSVKIPIYNPSIFHPREPSSPTARVGTPRIEIDDDPMSSPGGAGKQPPRAPEGELNATWEMWDIVRSVCDYNTRLTLTLDLTPPLPLNLGVLRKWAAEPVQHIYLPASTFIANTKGYPVLPKGTQSFIRDSMAHRPTIILAGVGSGVHARGGEPAYAQYVRHLEKTSPAVQASMKAGTVENFANGYQDYLQAPLQPLMDNLQSLTYQTFEQDPVKYQNYEEAIYRALEEWPANDRIVICVAGAGRGPLVARCLSAITRSRRQGFIYAVEKNPNAYVTLQGRQETEWKDKVKLVFGDMRLVEIPEKADILVTELLGSFGDNELSPECLDGASRFLKPDGISIPSSYTAHLAPISSSKLYNEARSGKDEKSLETPYVVMFQAINLLSGNGGGLGDRCGSQVQECWDFEHPRKDAVLNAQGLPPTNSHNARSAKLAFHIPHAGVLHGLAGYFEAVLYGNIGLSIHPDRKDRVSKDMLSWFPLFFPFKAPLYLPSNSELQVSIWRLTNKRQVWYEWYAESFMPVFNTPTDGTVDDSESVMSNHESFFASLPTHMATPSPLIDAIDAQQAGIKERRNTWASVDSFKRGDLGVVKIGQTSLHNAGGKSSWIGL